MMEGLHTYLYTAKIAVSQSIISKKSSATMIVGAVIFLFQKLLTSLLMYYTMASAAFVLYEQRDKNK
jgi:hypothetical protein